MNIEISGSTLAGEGEVGYKYSFDNSSWNEYNEIITYNIEIEEATVYAKAYNKAHPTMESEVATYKRQLYELVRQQGFTEYADLLDYLLDNQMFTEFDIASSHTLYLNVAITSARHRAEKIKPPKVDEETGEVIE